MAFEILRFVRQTDAYNAGQISTTFNPNAPAVLENGPAIFSYASATDDIATIGGADYFADVVYSLSVNDLIFCVGSDASAFYQVATVDRDAQTVTVVSASPSGVIGTANIQDDAVTTAKLADDAVTEAKLADDAVSTDKIVDDAVTNAKIADDAVSLENLDAGIAPSHIVAFAGQETSVGGAAAEAFTVTGAAATDLAFVQLVDPGTNTVSVVNAVVTTNTLTVTFSADPGADAVINYQLLRAAS